MFLAAESVRTWYNFIIGVEVPYPSFVDLFYILGSLSLIAGIFLVTRGLKVKNKGINPIVIILDIVLWLAIIASYLVLTDTLSQETIDSVIVLDLAYPVLDVVCVVLVVNLLLASFNKGVFEAQVILAVGAGIMCISDIYYSLSNYIDIYYPGSLSDTLLAISYVLLAISAYRYVELTRLDILVDRVSSPTPK